MTPSVAQNEPNGRVPLRACAGCRAKLPSAELVRFALEGERVVVDLERRRGGRGVNLGPTRRCLEQALKRGAFQRGFRQQVPRAALEALPSALGRAFSAALARACAGALRSGHAAAVARDEDVRPLELRALRQASPPMGEAPRIAVVQGPISAQIAWLTRGVSEFTFDMAGGIGPRLRGQAPCLAASRSRSPSEKA